MSNFPELTTTEELNQTLIQLYSDLSKAKLLAHKLNGGVVEETDDKNPPF